MQTSSQEITIPPEREAKMHLSCEEIPIKFFEMEIALLPVLRA
jgi:hypothetical protein